MSASLARQLPTARQQGMGLEMDDKLIYDWNIEMFPIFKYVVSEMFTQKNMTAMSVWQLVKV